MSGTAAQSEGKAMVAQPSWGFRLPVWRSKADKLAQALGDYAVERGRVRVTPLVRWNSWGVSVEVNRIGRADRHLGDPLGERRQWHFDSRAQIGPCILLIDVSSSYTHRNFAESANQVDEHAAQAMPSGAMRPIRMAGSSGRPPLINAALKQAMQQQYPPTNKFTRTP